MEQENHLQHLDYQITVKDYLLFGAIILFIFAASGGLYTLSGDFVLSNYMGLFMGVFFVVFAFFKLLDLGGFAIAYSGYDIIAQRVLAYGYIYPFIELGLGVGYFLALPSINWFTLVIMAIGSVGVVKELLRGSKIKCACLGTYIKLPLTTVSLTEDLVMGLMALGLLVFSP